MQSKAFRPPQSLPFPALVLLFAAVAVAGCSGRHSLVLQGPALDELRRQQQEKLGAAFVVPFEISDEMRAWVRERVPINTPHQRRLDILVESLFNPKDFKLEYDAETTGTAREVFASRRGNCLAFTSLFVGLAREVGAPVFYLDVEEVEEFEKVGDLVVVSGHISAGFRSGKELKIYDFSPNPEKQFRPVRSISDRTAIALHYSNRGAELLRAGEAKEALRWLRAAVELDPDHPRPWINLGVAERRTGDVKAAEVAYRRALEMDASAASAYQNLATLLKLQGKGAEAESLLALTARLKGRNPYNYLALGDLSLGNRRFEEARRFYKRALNLERKGAEPFAAMGQLALASGDPDEALLWLKRARAIDQENPRVRSLASQLGA